jgi:SAM-dependent methyltransferase
MTPQQAANEPHEQNTLSAGADIPIYSKFAGAYSAGDERVFSERMAYFALERAGRYARVPLRCVADAACGIGAACLVFAKRGLNVIGIDQSPEMIRIAARDAQRSGLDVQLLIQDLRNLVLDRQADLVTCMYDSLNLIETEADLEIAFRSVSGALVVGGIFVFDIYTIRGLAEVWGSHIEIHTNTADHFVASQTNWNYETSTNEKTLFGFSLKDGNWEHWRERHRARGYSLNRVQALLDNTGFKVCEITDWDNAETGVVNENTLRAVFIAERR